MGEPDSRHQLKSDPIVSVVMPVFNAEDRVGSALRSLLKQTQSGIEILVLDDGSTDHTCAVVQSLGDRRIRLIQNHCNIGVARTLNKGIRLARGKFVARMDADDVSNRHRLEKQVQFMESHPSIGISGTWVRFFGKQPPVIDRKPVGTDRIRAYLLFDNALYHPTVIIRKCMLHRFRLRYDPTFHRTEDYELWCRAIDHFPLDNIPEPLLWFRCHDNSVTSTDADTMRSQAHLLIEKGLHRLHIELTEKQLAFHYEISKGFRLDRLTNLIFAGRWIEMLIEQNRKVAYCSDEAFRQVSGMIWLRLCLNNTQFGLDAWKIYRSFRLSRYYRPAFSNRIWLLTVAMMWSLRHRIK